MTPLTLAELEYLEHLHGTCAWIPNEFTEPAKTVGAKLRAEILRRTKATRRLVKDGARRAVR